MPEGTSSSSPVRLALLFGALFLVSVVGLYYSRAIPPIPDVAAGPTRFSPAEERLLDALHVALLRRESAGQRIEQLEPELERSPSDAVEAELDGIIEEYWAAEEEIRSLLLVFTQLHRAEEAENRERIRFYSSASVPFSTGDKIALASAAIGFLGLVSSAYFAHRTDQREIAQLRLRLQGPRPRAGEQPARA